MENAYPDQLKYSPPDGSVGTYVNNALGVLSDIEFVVPDFYEEFLRSDIVLTLSGVRTMCSDITFSSHIEDGRQTAQLRKVLESHNITLLTFGSEQILLNVEALVELESRYPFAAWPQVPQEINSDSFRAWITDVTLLIQNEIEPILGQEIEPTHIWLGMLYGYPGNAIMDYASKTPFMVKTDIENADANSGASVNYKIKAEDQTSSDVQAHTNLWGEILKSTSL